MAYPLTGPFTDGGAPGISSAFLNNVESWIKTIDNPTPVQSNGSSGNIKIYQFMQGVIKSCFVFWAGYRSTTAQTLVIPSPFLAGCMFWVAESQAGTLLFKSGGTTVTCSVMNTLSSSGGTENAATPTSWTFGQTRGGFDSLTASFPSVASGYMFFIGL